MTAKGQQAGIGCAFLLLAFVGFAACGALVSSPPLPDVEPVVDSTFPPSTTPAKAVAPKTSRAPAPAPLKAPTRAPQRPAPATRAASPRPVAPKPLVTAPAATYYANCAAVKAAGKAPIRKGQPGYSSKLDRDGDGIACET